MSRQRSSRSNSRAPISRAHSRASSVTYFPVGAETLVTPDGPIGSEAAQLLGGLLTPQHEPENSSSTLVGDSADPQGKTTPAGDDSPEREEEFEFNDAEDERLELEERANRPFYRRPSPWWIVMMVPLSSVAMSTTIAPRVEIYTKLACEALRPEYTISNMSIRGLETVTPPSVLCGKDPDVQAAVAKLITIMTVSMGILSCITTGWWGQLSDRYGRMFILKIATFGLLLNDFNFILVSLAANRLPGGYRFLLVGPAFDGLLGGMSTLTAGLHAYISDCTPPEQRSRMFSLNMGLLFGGLALGPTLGGLAIRATNDLLSVFYLATGSHIVFTFLIFFVIPESLTGASMRVARKRREARRSEEAVACSSSVDLPRGEVIKTKALSFFKKLFAFLSPLHIFLPFKRPEGKGWNWNLTLVVLSYTFSALLMGSYQFKFQYAQKAFGWNSEILGYWLSVIGIVRALHLVVILPLVIKFFTPKTPPIQLPVGPSEPLHPSRSASVDSAHRSRSLSRPRAPKHSPIFDLGLAQFSLAIEFISYIAMTLSSSSLSWTVATVFGSFGGGFSPAMQSVALALYERGPNEGIETGRLFGGLSVIQALSTQIVGPSLFGLTYVSTVNVFPKGIFVVAAIAVACALLFMSCVRFSTTPPKTGHDQEETAVEDERD